MDRKTRKRISLVTGLGAMVLFAVFLFPMGCDDGGLAWDCYSPLGTPTSSVEDFGLNNAFDLLVPPLIGLLVGFVTWLLLGVTSQSNDD